MPKWPACASWCRHNPLRQPQDDDLVNIPSPLTKEKAKEVRAALKHIDPDLGYEDWIKIGQALHSGSPAENSPGFKLWVKWSMQGEKFAGTSVEEMRAKWLGFKPGRGITLGTLFKRAKDGGYSARESDDEVPPQDATDDEDLVVAELNKKHAFVSIVGKSAVLTEVVDPVLHRRDFTLSTQQDMRMKYANRTARVGDRRVNIFDLWLRSPQRREYAGIVFAPKRDVPGYYNLWRGFAVEPHPGDCGLFLAHVRDNVCQGDARLFEYVEAWMAQLIQAPGERPGVSLVLRGGQGVGKSIVADTIGMLLGQHYVPVTTPRHLTGNFNAHLKDAILVFANEAFWAGDKAAEGTLKAMVTEGTRLLEFKGKDAVTIRNHVWLMIASNHDWVVPAGLDERRFCVMDVGAAHMQDHAYFGAMVDQLEHGGYAALLHHLLYLDISRVKLRMLPPTAALLETKFLSMSPVQKFIFEWLREANEETWVCEVERDWLHRRYVEFALTAGERRRASETELGIALKKMIPSMRSVRPTKDGRRMRLYVMPPLADCRAAVKATMRSER